MRFFPMVLGLCLLSLARLPALAQTVPPSPFTSPPANESKLPTASKRVIQLSTPPLIHPDSLPVIQSPGGGSPVSTETLSNTPDYMTYQPYNTFPREMDLWNLEGKRLIRGIPVVSPDKDRFAYSEVMFTPNTRQTYSRIYLVPVEPLPAPPQAHLPSEEAQSPPAPPPNPELYAARFDPAKTMRLRRSLVSVGYNKVERFDFKTLTVVDWSENGQRLLMKERNGVLHYGLRISDILVYDEDHGTVTIYPEIHRVIKYYWTTQGNLPHIDQISWDIQPLGWQPGSNSAILLKAWAYDKKEKKFLGLWEYDVDAERTQLIRLADDPIAVAANGWMATPVPIPPPKSESAWKTRLKHPFGHAQELPSSPSTR